MRRARPLALVLALVLGGCRVPDEKGIAGLKQEIASLGSAAKLNAPWSKAQVSRIDVDVLAAQAHVDQLAR